jgi:predicted acylesterase/phospholipase RssA
MKRIKRAITLGGGGPAAGLHIGALRCLKEQGIDFDIWALSCIGAWVGIVYHQCEKRREVEQTYKFFHDGVFRDDQSYSKFPINSVFGPDLGALSNALARFLTNPESYQDLLLPGNIAQAAIETVSFLADTSKWNEGDFNRFVLNDLLAVNPASRFLTSLIYLSNLTGLSRIYYPGSSFLKAIKLEELTKPEKPLIYHNAWNLTRAEQAPPDARLHCELFANKQTNERDGVTSLINADGPITEETLCACSALPYIEEPIRMKGQVYCEGALIDTVSFEQLIECNPDLDEVWVSRIVSREQVRPPENLTEALGNLCMLFAGSLGDDDIRLFKYKARYDNDPPWKGQIVEIQVSKNITFDWSRKNLDRGCAAGYEAAHQACRLYREGYFTYRKEQERRNMEKKRLGLPPKT